MKSNKLILAFLCFSLSLQALAAKPEQPFKLDRLTKIIASDPDQINRDIKKLEISLNILAKASYALSLKYEEAYFASVIKFASELASADKSRQVGKFILPLWKAHPQKLLEHTSKLPAQKRKELKQQIKLALQSERGQ